MHTTTRHILHETVLGQSWFLLVYPDLSQVDRLCPIELTADWPQAVIEKLFEPTALEALPTFEVQPHETYMAVMQDAPIAIRAYETTFCGMPVLLLITNYTGGAVGVELATLQSLLELMTANELERLAAQLGSTTSPNIDSASA